MLWAWRLQKWWSRRDTLESEKQMWLGSNAQTSASSDGRESLIRGLVSFFRGLR